MNTSVLQYFRCPESYIRFALKGPLSAQSGFFRLGTEATCYGTYCGQQPSSFPSESLHDSMRDIEILEGTIRLPFDPSDVVANLYGESYIGDWRHGSASFLAKMYYFLRPALGVAVRKRVQRFHLRGWKNLSFPRWPLDCSVDNIFGQLILLSLRASGVERIPFIWFWPEGSSSCAVMTHDVETKLGKDFCPTLMDIDDSFGIKASFQIIPEERYTTSRAFLQSIRERGFEVVVHDLNHDGHLYKNRKQFLERAARINSYGKEYGASGFRAGVLYRKQIWYDALTFAYDMSVPNVAHLDPQRGGCCTVMPYFIGEMLELPVTTTQDYALFNILGEYSTSLWKRQIKLIRKKNGLMNFIVHPDYVVSGRERRIYEELLGEIAQLKAECGVWVTLPGEVNRWWRQRADMRLVSSGNGWKIEGEGSERARIAYASEQDGHLKFTLQDCAPIEDETTHSSSAGILH